jgi:hypothetical protein
VGITEAILAGFLRKLPKKRRLSFTGGKPKPHLGRMQRPETLEDNACATEIIVIERVRTMD